MFRFTIRDVLWLTVIVGLALGWWLEYRQFVRVRRDQLRERRLAIANKYSRGEVPFLDLSRVDVELDEAEVAAADTAEERQDARRRMEKHLRELSEARSRMSQ
jgi:hypothetical protein